jgi:predicted HicB family RNase H-like nuclease
MSGTTKASQRAVNKYIANNYDRLNITVPKGKKYKYKLAAEAEGKSLNAFIVECIEKRMEERE